MAAVSPFDGANRIRFKGSRRFRLSAFTAPPNIIEFKLGLILEPIKGRCNQGIACIISFVRNHT